MRSLAIEREAVSACPGTAVTAPGTFKFDHVVGIARGRSRSATP